jgi:decaprenylphospho-beta-D-erythro-pentofuranosid-2-ulose 2-reductase
MSKNVLILGATSDIALAIAREFAAQGYSITLAARNLEKLKAIEADLIIRYKVTIYSVFFDALDYKGHADFYTDLPVKPDVAICVFGLLGNQAMAQVDLEACLSILYSNYVGAVSIINQIANDFEIRREGVIVGISSVAGERGRQSNYFYGSAKAGFTAYLSGLRNRLYTSGVHVVTVKPGFVRTKMLENINTPNSITASPKQVASAVFCAVKKQKNVIYTLSIWRIIMFIIRNIPEGIFKKLKL